MTTKQIAQQMDQLSEAADVLSEAASYLDCSAPLPNYKAIDLLNKLRKDVTTEYEKLESSYSDRIKRFFLTSKGVK